MLLSLTPVSDDATANIARCVLAGVHVYTSALIIYILLCVLIGILIKRHHCVSVGEDLTLIDDEWRPSAKQ